MNESLSSRWPVAQRISLGMVACWALLWVLGLVLIPSSGCGQAEYERRMDRRAGQLRQSSRAANDNSAADEQTDPLDADEEL